MVLLLVLLGAMISLVTLGARPQTNARMSVWEAGQPAIGPVNPTASVQQQAPDIPLATLWDNGDTDGSNGYSNMAASVTGIRRAEMDDFVVPGGSTWNITALSWLMSWSNNSTNSGTGAEVRFRADAAGTPGAIIATATVTGWTEVVTGRSWYGFTEERAQATFNTIVLGPGHYWVEYLPIGPVNAWAWVRLGITEIPAWINWDDYGFTSAYVVASVYVDFSWQLLGTSAGQGYDLGFMDDYGRSQLCVNSTTGDWQYSVLMGNGAGKVYTGTGTVVNGSGYMRLTATPGSASMLSLMYYTTAHRASATFSYRLDGVSSALYDANTLDDEVSCGGAAPN